MVTLFATVYRFPRSLTREPSKNVSLPAPAALIDHEPDCSGSELPVQANRTHIHAKVYRHTRLNHRVSFRGAVVYQPGFCHSVLHSRLLCPLLTQAAFNPTSS